MWMCYVTDIEVTDLKSGVESLHQLFSNLEFDASHEAIYGAVRPSPYSSEYCTELARKYEKGVEICDLYLKNQICLYGFVSLLKVVELDGYLIRIKKFLPSALYGEEGNNEGDTCSNEGIDVDIHDSEDGSSKS
uniref:Uncharacterized protein LOC114345818 n=1 Tax=Diabrotica virgifera virgifera TaxID=50390 RepID=A0A6P7H3Y8_DIAVI